MDPQPKNILIVDDHLDNLELLKGIISSTGANVAITEFDHPHKALSFLHASKNYWPDLVITDYQMPDMNGQEFAREARTRMDPKGLIALWSSAMWEPLGVTPFDHVFQKDDNDGLIKLVREL